MTMDDNNRPAAGICIKYRKSIPKAVKEQY